MKIEKTKMIDHIPKESEIFVTSSKPDAMTPRVPTDLAFPISYPFQNVFFLDFEK